MRAKMVMFLMMSILSACLVGCSNVSVLKNQDDGTTKNTPTIEPSIEAVKEPDRKVDSSAPPTEDAARMVTMSIIMNWSLCSKGTKKSSTAASFRN
ncbi:hypothetical protein B9T62_36115 [Paenibacillus donghaensis]|uniref:Uncharacterized protein n=1 Tax=Paenibacillus donghaensis TaxID=414771 RepID=A0A2Z2KHG1_9BACL|nr:hypothetical protein B9T62_36115 [Paenibacillus donghaensis]